MKRQQAFINKGNKMLKGGLHCHTTRSDGLGTPEEVEALHKQNGYDFLAITDHRRYNYRDFAPELDLLIIPGMEFDNGKIDFSGGRRCFHTVCIGPEKENGNGFTQYEESEKLPAAVAMDQEAYQPYLDDIHEKKNLTIYCHPEWSATPARYFEKMQGNFAIEVWNTGCVMECNIDSDAPYWDELLGEGVKLYGVATDDGHTMDQHCKGWVMVNAEKTVNSVLSALEAGEFYASCGPEIYDFYVEDGKVHVECSPVNRIRLHSNGHATKMKIAEGESITSAEIKLDSFPYDYVRVSVVDEDGKIAWTNPIFFK